MTRTIRHWTAGLFKHAAFRRNHSTSSHELVTRSLRELLRDTAQPVAVVTSLMPKSDDTTSNKSLYHGATLSSFTSIAMDPYPLVSFALRIPSRMATSLNTALPEQPCHMVINLLSAEQSSVAVAFSRPDLHPHPFEEVSYTLTEEGLPVIERSLGAISCKLVSAPLPLHDLDFLERRTTKINKDSPVIRKGMASELFIARVTRVEETSPGPSRTLPLLYYHRGFTTLSATPSSGSPT
ncbi:hypothetical protein AX17_007234 [Amanita inopinata Kibby_2008]|nr:hypothetical protein AX17_007234 [Amanita inopinata Kibby_2008]